MRKFKFVTATLLASSMLLASCGHEHTFEEKWTSDTEYHWHASTCGHDVTSGKEAHSWGEWSVKTAATCTEDGVEERICTVCGETEQKPISATGHSYGSDGICTGCGDYDEAFDTDSLVFTTEKLGSLNGEFYCYGFTLEVSKDGATLNDGMNTINLTNNRIKGSKFNTVATYKDDEQHDYTLCWSKATWDLDNVGYMLPTLKANGSEIQFQPSIEKAQGWYTGYGNAVTGNVVYIVQNNFDPMSNYFLGSAAHASYPNYVVPESTIWSSSFREIGGEIYLSLSYYFLDDAQAGIPFETYFLYGVQEYGKLFLMYEDGSDYAFGSSVMMLLSDFTYFNPADCEAEWPSSVEGCTFYGLDEETKYVMDFDWNDVTYIEGFDEQGHYVDLNGTILRGNGYGITLDDGDSVIEYPACDMSNSTGFSGLLNSYSDFVSGENTISFYGDDIYVNEDAASSVGYTIIDHQVYIKFSVEEDNYLVSAADAGVALVNKNGVSSYYLDSWSYGETFVCDYYDESLADFIVDSSNVVTTGGKTYQGYLNYDSTYGVILEYDESKFLFALNPDENLFAVFDREDSAFLKIIVPQKNILSCYGSFSDGSSSLVISNAPKLVYNLTTYDFVSLNLLTDQFGSFYPSLCFSSSALMKTLQVSFSYSGIELYEVAKTSLNYISSFIKKADFEAVVGEYYYNGEYGKETIKLESNGTLTVDTLNETKDGIIPVVYDYIVKYDEKGNVVIGFLVETSQGIVTVPIVFSGIGCSIDGLQYITKAIYDNAGLFGTKDEYLSIADNGSIFFNGQEVKNISLNNGEISGTYGGLFDSKSIKIAFDQGNAVVTSGEDAPITLNKVEVAYTLADFACEPQINVSEQGQDVKITAEGIFYRATGSSEETPWQKVKSYYFGIEEDGTISLKFDTVPAVHNTAVIEGGVVTITAVFSL